jgi:hypothetical protein
VPDDDQVQVLYKYRWRSQKEMKNKMKKTKKITKKKGQKNYNLTETSLNKITEISLTCKDTEKTHNSIK